MPAASRSSYHLQVCPGDSLQGPSDEEIDKVIRSLPGGVPSFAVLTKKKNHFMQAGGSVAEGFQLEYQEFSRDGHWEHVTSGELTPTTVIQALQWYAQGDDKWRQLQWTRLVRSEIEERNEAAWSDWHASQPREGFFKGLLKTLMEIVVDKSRRH